MEAIVAVRALHMAGTVLAAGVFAFRFLVLPADPAHAQARRVADALRILCLAGLGLAVATWLAWLPLVAAGMSGRPLSQAVAPEILWTVIARTTFGQAWAVRLVLFALLAADLLLAHRHALRATGAGLALAALLGLAWTGHALDATPAQRAADALHALGAGLWLGALVPLLLLLRQAARDGAPWVALAAVATVRFSRLGIAAVALLVATGWVNAARLVGPADALVGTFYGRLLLAKLGLFALMLAIAAVNRFVLTPRLQAGDRGAAIARLRRNVVAEVVLGAAVLGVVGVLGVTEPGPPAHDGAHMALGGM